ncbi:hypothetical protein B1P92_07250 [Enterococcus faecium]|nr:hypothetical protein B1P92_07250 [Enterococcus faecium]
MIRKRPKTDTLDEEGLKAAGRKMMETLFEKEQLNETGYWMATIHRNTKHIHIHFAVVEKHHLTKSLKFLQKKTTINFLFFEINCLSHIYYSIFIVI